MFKEYKYSNSIDTNYIKINSRIIFLEERISHHQNSSNNFASLWLILMSVLFITVTGFNLYNYNNSKKDLEEKEIIIDSTIKKIKLYNLNKIPIELPVSNNKSEISLNDGDTIE